MRAWGHLRAPSVLALALIGVAAAACTKYEQTRTFVYGPLAVEGNALVDHTVTALRARGYEPTGVDAAHGRVEVPSRWQARSGPPSTFVVQLYRGGWVQVTVASRFRKNDADADAFSVPSKLREEYEMLLVGLREGGLR